MIPLAAGKCIGWADCAPSPTEGYVLLAVFVLTVAIIVLLGLGNR